MTFETLIGFDNKVNSSFTFTNVITLGSGSITNESNKPNLFNRSVTDAYTFDKGLGGEELTLTITPDADINIKLVALLGFSSGLIITEIRFYKSAAMISSLTNNISVINKRYVNGYFLEDYIYTWDNEITVDSIEIDFDVSTASSSLKYGSFYASNKMQIDVEPKISYATIDKSNKKASNGGLVFSNRYATVRTVKFKSTPIGTSAMFSTTISSPTLINSISGSSEPIIFAPFSSGNTMIYGTQKKPSTINQVIAKDNLNNWYWTASFEIEEEL